MQDRAKKLTKIRKTVTRILEKAGLGEDEVIVMLYGSRDNWLVWFYPSNPNMLVVSQLMGSAMLHLKSLDEQLEARKKIEKIDKLRKVYTC